MFCLLKANINGLIFDKNDADFDHLAQINDKHLEFIIQFINVVLQILLFLLADDRKNEPPR